MADSTVAHTFRSGTYYSYKTTKPTKLYRTQSNGELRGRYWSTQKPTGPTQATLDLALDPTFKNKATHWFEIEVPANTELSKGIVSPIKNTERGVELLGGGEQVYLGTDPLQSWVKDTGVFK